MAPSGLPALLAGLLIPLSAQGSPPRLRVATWNMEWLVSPATTRTSRLACLAGHRRTALPCDVALGAARTGADFARLRHYADLADADVIAFQEVEDIDTAARVFTHHSFCMGAGRRTQNLGFAIRRGLRFACQPDIDALAPAGHGRPGAAVLIDPGGPREIHLLTVHLKSGCADGPLDSRREACDLLAAQLPLVGDWMQAQDKAGRRHAVLGDFNRGWDAGVPPGALQAGGARGRFGDASRDAGFSSCFAGQVFTRYIDHLLVGLTGSLRVVPGSFFRIRYTPEDVRHYQLSDHCPTGTVLQFASNTNGTPQHRIGQLA